MKKLLLIISVAIFVSSTGGVLINARTFDPNFKLVQDVVAPPGMLPAKPVAPTPLTCNKIDAYIPSTIDMALLRKTWLKWNNDLRIQAGLNAYMLEPELDWSAQNWSDRAKRLGTISHKRDDSTAYYDYKKILTWFNNLGLEFKNAHGTTMTENIGWGIYKCPADGSDCTPAMTKAIRTTFDFYVGEKGKKSDAHWRSLMQKDFKEIGLGLALDRVKHKYYLTIHYATAITSKPVAICQA